MPSHTQAIIIGASIAGLVAARVSAENFDHVLMLERDSLEDGEQRKGAAQSFHAHVLLHRGLRELENLFPCISAELLGVGAQFTNAGKDWYAEFQKGLVCEFDTDIVLMCVSRTLLETVLRRKLLSACANVSISDNTSVTSVKLDGDKPQVVATHENGHTEIIQADLLIDATGRNSKASQWLVDAGFQAPALDGLEPKLRYATRYFKDVTLPQGKRAILTMAVPPAIKTGALLMPIEDNTWICTLYGLAGTVSPADEEGFLEFAKTAQSDFVYKGICNATAVSDIKSFSKPDTVVKSFANGRWPSCFVVIGDAIASFNPIYGQGMTSAIIAATVLSKELKSFKPSISWAKRSQKKLNRVYMTAWKIGYSEDMRWPETNKGKMPLAMRLEHKLGDLINQSITKDPVVSKAFYQVLHMIEKPESLLKPKILFRILAGAVH